jgi:putative membrane protein
MEFSLKKSLGGFLYGLLFGFGSPVPGVSAGTMAIMLNVYDKFFSSINIDAAKKNFISIITFLLGWAIGLFGISSIMMFLFYYHRQIISFIFIGLILGCVPMIYKKATAEKTRLKNVALSFVAFGFMAFVAFFGDDMAANNNLEQMGGITPALLAWVFFASFVSSKAMLIPGVGGSLMMLVFGIYTVYIESVASLNALLLAIFGSSMVLGVLAGILITKKMLEKFSQTLYCAILGFVLGSILFLFPSVGLDINTAVAVSWGAVCFIFAFWLSKKG